MADAAQLKAQAAARLMEGSAAAVKAATRHASDYLQAIGAPAPVLAYPLLHPTAAIGARGVDELRVIEDAVVAPTARLTEGLQQHLHWAAPYQPPPLRVLALQRAVALAPNVIVTVDGQLLDDAQAVAFEADELAWVVGEEAHRPDAEVAEDAAFLDADRFGDGD